MSKNLPFYNMGKANVPSGAPADAARAAFATRLQKAMVAKGWNQSELARRAASFMEDGKFGRDNVSVYMRAKAFPGPAHLHALSRALDLDPKELLPSRGVPSAEDSATPFEMWALDGGKVWLKVNQAVDMSVGVKILQLLEGQDAA